MAARPSATIVPAAAQHLLRATMHDPPERFMLSRSLPFRAPLEDEPLTVMLQPTAWNTGPKPCSTRKIGNMAYANSNHWNCARRICGSGRSCGRQLQIKAHSSMNSSVRNPGNAPIA